MDIKFYMNLLAGRECIYNGYIQLNLYIKATQGGVYEQLPSIFRLKSYTLFINGKNETALHRKCCYIEVPFMAGLTVYIYMHIYKQFIC